MKPTDPRDHTWQELQGTLHGTWEMIHGWLLRHGPATTKQMAEALGISLLTVRPRVSELCACGFAECVGRGHREGIYAAITQGEAHRRHEASRREAQTNFQF